MSQISPPIRIVVIAAIGLMVAWMLFLRPKTEEAPVNATAPGVTGLTNAVDKAKGAAATQEASNAAVQKATGEETDSETAAKSASKSPTAQPAAKGAAARKGLPRPVQKAIDDKRVLVLLFWNPKSADDRAVKRAVAKADRWSGDVFVRTADVKSVSRYGKITRGAAVGQSPTVVVVDRNRKAENLVGYVDTRSVDQAVLDAFRNSGVLIKDKYLRRINDACATAGVQQAAVVDPSSAVEIAPAIERQERVFNRFLVRFKAIPAPAKWRGLKRGAVKDGAALSANLGSWSGYLGSTPTTARAVTSVGRYNGRQRKLTKSFNARMDKHHVLSCGAQT